MKKGSESEQEVLSHVDTINDTTSSASFTVDLQDASFEHAVAPDTAERFRTVFQRIIVNTGAVKYSTAGSSQ